MRCPSCGTENAPDSRFCGGCGARLEPSRVAPTLKVTDDKPHAAPAGQARLPTPPPGSLHSIGNLPTPAPGSMSYPRAGSIPPTNNPASIPPTNQRIASQPPASIPPTSSPGTIQRRAGTPPPVAMSSPSMSMPVPPRRNGTVIAILVIFDLGLAAAGGLMLAKGLARPKAAEAKAATTGQRTEAAAPSPAPIATTAAPAAAPGSASPAPGSAAPPVPEPIGDAKTVARDAKKDPKKRAAPDRKSGGGGGGGGKLDGPLDPYQGATPSPPGPDLSADIERMAAQSFGTFRSCLDNAIQTQPIHGQIRISFAIEADGHVDRTQAVVNTTGSDALATCLSQAIATWTFTPHAGPAASYERPFNYP